MKPLQDHPIASIFPLLSEPELIELSADIQKNGVQVPIVLFEDKILDGRNRYRAAVMAGAHCPVTYYHGEEPTAHVLSLNLHRRHLTQSQKAAIGAEAEPHYAEEARKRQANSTGGATPQLTAKLPEAVKGEAREKAAEAVGVSPRYVSDAKAIKEASPETFEKVKTGELSIPQAKEEVRRRADPIPEPELTPEQEARVEEAEKDSEALWKLKSDWRKTGKKDRAAFLAWIKTQ